MGHIDASLGEVLFSGVQRRLLALFYGQPDRSFYTNELLRLTATGRGGLQRELARLVSAGLIYGVTVGNQKHYQANRAAPIFNELRGIVLKTFGLADVLREALAPVADKIELAFIFGSIAKGNDTASSDIDLLIVSDEIAYAELFDALAAAEATLGRMINPTLYATAELERKVLADNHFVTRVLAQPKIFLKGDEDGLPVGQTAQGQ
ncbi:MAG: nucleotidyltransferase domain-containing protein [Gammaproteobacteria bacterium]|nr:nucleotidyltransferase domain-containing protein [Gammaproteobacteria bacterium]MBU1645531.1 nucleotidyltransferase domain-containing protein [Gammaproteobacteria bacterium]MBU1973667.1 nucleotidyltransferase domain-containing protein [Gammaproteobacteria bacterium]